MRHTGLARPTPLLAALMTGVALVGWLDYAIFPELGLSLFYLPHVVLAGWRIGRGGALTVGLFAAAAWTCADIATLGTGHLFASGWNGTTRLAIFVSMGLLTARVRRDRDRLSVLLAREKSLARTDVVTGLVNFRGLLEALMTEVSRCRRSRRPLCLVYIDLDNFKQVNDRFGHAAGDALLKRAGDAIVESIRAGDVCGRLGGDEFAVLLWEAEQETAERIARRLSDRIRKLGESFPGIDLGASLGVAWFETPPDSAEEVLRQGDGAMYEAKTRGKGRMVFRRHGGCEPAGRTATQTTP